MRALADLLSLSPFSRVLALPSETTWGASSTFQSFVSWSTPRTHIVSRLAVPINIFFRLETPTGLVFKDEKWSNVRSRRAGDEMVLIARATPPNTVYPQTQEMYETRLTILLPSACS